MIQVSFLRIKWTLQTVVKNKCIKFSEKWDVLDIWYQQLKMSKNRLLGCIQQIWCRTLNVFVSYLWKCGVTAGFSSILKNNSKCNPWITLPIEINKHRKCIVRMYERFLLWHVGPNTYPDLVAKLFRFLSQLFQLTHCSCLTGTRDDNVLDLQSKHHTMTSPVNPTLQ